MYNKKVNIVNKKDKSVRLVFIVGISSLAVLLCGIFWFVIYHPDHNNNNLNTEDRNAKTTSTAPTAQSDYKNGSPRSTATNTGDKGTVIDNNGSIPATPPQGQWSHSENDAIIVYDPAANSQIKPGQYITGTSTFDKVAFRIIDNISGVIASGSLKVVDGKFAGTLNFDTKATEGRIDIFNQQQDGTESDNVYIVVRF